MNLATQVQAAIEVEVAFYNSQHKQKLLALPCGQQMDQLTAHPVAIPTGEFLTYYLFHRKRLKIRAYRSYQSIGKKTNQALSAIDECLDYNGRSLCTPAGTVTQLNEISEHVGEAVGLSIASRVHGLTEADWEPIQEQHGPEAHATFDFQIASDGRQIIEVENKGSSVDDNTQLSDQVRQHKRSITRKKAELTKLRRAKKGRAPAPIRYGTITAIDPRRNGRIKCWLVDPPPEPAENNPNVLKLLHRMRFLRNWICSISYRSPLAAALASRVADLEHLSNPFELSGVSLLHGNGRPFDLSPYSPHEAHSRFFSTKSKTTEGLAGGIVVQLSEKALFFIGIRQDLLKLAVAQVFDDILTFKAPVDSTNKTVECVISQGRFDRMALPDSLQVEQREGYAAFRLSGVIHHSPGGLVFGVLPLPLTPEKPAARKPRA